MNKARLHIFNPDTDYALASGRRYYTAPAQVVALRKRLALLPALYAHPGDAILLLDAGMSEENTMYAKIAEEKCLRILALTDLAGAPDILEDYIPDPWGWNLSIRQLLLDAGADPTLLPTTAQLERLRALSHRRTTIEFLKALPAKLMAGISIPFETDDTERAMNTWEENRKIFFKAPWSSSGRGILLGDDIDRRHVEPWVRGIIRRQGSVMVEKAYERRLDFATEWMMTAGEARFLGFSVFLTSRRGKYHGNVEAGQEELSSMIERATHLDLDEIVRGQKSALERVIGKDYDGPAGIDMLATVDGNVNCCVELNIRHTMGMTGLL